MSGILLYLLFFTLDANQESSKERPMLLILRASGSHSLSTVLDSSSLCLSGMVNRSGLIFFGDFEDFIVEREANVINPKDKASNPSICLCWCSVYFSVSLKLTLLLITKSMFCCEDL